MNPLRSRCWDRIGFQVVCLGLGDDAWDRKKEKWNWTGKAFSPWCRCDPWQEKSRIGQGDLKPWYRANKVVGNTVECRVSFRGVQALLTPACSIHGWGCLGREWLGWETGADPKKLQPETLNQLHFSWLSQSVVSPLWKGDPSVTCPLWLSHRHVCLRLAWQDVGDWNGNQNRTPSWRAKDTQKYNTLHKN